MTNLMTKSSLYDMLSMIIPGFLFILCVEVASGIPIKGNFEYVTSGIITFSLSYVVGIMLHLVSKRIFDPVLRNDEETIQRVSEDFKADIDKTLPVITDYYRKYYHVVQNYPYTVIPILEAQVAFLRSLLLVIPTAAVALLVSRCSCWCLKISPSCCLCLYTIFLAVICLLLACCHCKCKRVHLQKVCKKVCALLKSFLVALPLLIFLLPNGRFTNCDYNLPIGSCTAVILLILLEFSLFWVTLLRQEDIYYRVFEDNHYLKDGQGEGQRQ